MMGPIPQEIQTLVNEYRQYLEPTITGESVEVWLRDETPWNVNVVRAVVAAGMKYQLTLLLKLQHAGLLRPAAEVVEPTEGES